MEGTPQQEGNIEDFSKWKEQRDAALREVLERLEAKELNKELEGLSVEEAEELDREVTALIEEVSFDADNNIINENKFVARDLGVYQHQIREYIRYRKAPIPGFRQAA